MPIHVYSYLFNPIHRPLRKLKNGFAGNGSVHGYTHNVDGCALVAVESMGGRC